MCNSFLDEYLNETEVDLAPLYQDIAASLNAPGVMDTIFMFKTLSVIYFFSFCVSMLFYAGKNMRTSMR